MTDYTRIMRNRVSIRTYDGTMVEDSKLKELSAVAASHTSGPFGSRVRIITADTGEISKDRMKTYGTYGIVRGASVFLIGMIEKGGFPEDFGYVFENLVLEATRLGLGTCWLGGTFKRSVFAEAAAPDDDEILFAISPLGYAAGRRSIADKTVRALARSSTRLPFERIFFEGRSLTPLHENSSPVLKDLLEAVRIGPSASNKQPWRIVRIDDSFHFYLARSKGYGRGLEALDAPDLQRSDIGIAMCHFEHALGESADERPYPGRWVRDDPGIDCPFEYIASWKT